MDRYTKVFADYVVNTKMIPQESIHEAKRRILDSFGVMYAAFHEDAPKAVRKYAYMFETQDGSYLFGFPFKTTPEVAAFANGVLVRYLDFNDTYLSKEPLHPSDCIPGLWAVGEWKKIGGQKLLESIVVAYEIGVNLCDAASLRKHGWDHVNYVTIMEACGLGKLLGLEEQTIQHAISLALIPNLSARQTRAGELSMWKGAAAANSVRNAIFGTFLAMNGMSGPYQPFEGEMGFFKQVLENETFDDNALEPIIKQKEPKRILDTYIKFYPVEYHAQSVVDIVKKLHQYISSPDDIESIHIDTFKAAYEIIAKDKEKWEPKTKETADHSIQYITVVGILDGNITKHSFSKEKLNDPIVKKILSTKTTLDQKDELTAGYPDGIPNRVTLKTKDQKVYTEEVKYPKGHAKNKMSDEEVIEKFKNNAEGILTNTEMENVIDAVMNLEKCEDISKLAQLLRV
ncbi:MAG: MmgE/PrpD family protein [Desulfurella sp.]|uniref:MmgE/PrpD family protein n=1 Tax=Desulfurella TaxID=33001 RepID=UPI000CBA0819|nr:MULTISPECIES: MmgE/PrpD family protein [Desulfurella]PMP68346.1 MAG: propanediol utilization protein [Desulfurella multipotens]PMP88221.1 MAG: propanediol utilization protein [Desulfurella sp.]